MIYSVALEAFTYALTKPIITINNFDIHTYYSNSDTTSDLIFIRNNILGEKEFKQQVKNALEKRDDVNGLLTQGDNRFGFLCEFDFEISEEKQFYFILKYCDIFERILKKCKN